MSTSRCMCSGCTTVGRVQPCVQRAWCILAAEHHGPCQEVPRAAPARSEWDTRTPDPVGWRGKKAPK